MTEEVKELRAQLAQLTQQINEMREELDRIKANDMPTTELVHEQETEEQAIDPPPVDIWTELLNEDSRKYESWRGDGGGWII